MLASVSVFALSWNVVPPLQPRTSAQPVVDRRGLFAGALGAAAAAMMPASSANALIESSNPANNYYFPMAKYRYLPRIFRAWIAVDQLGPLAMEVGDWEGMEEAVRRADDAITALPLYTNAVEGSRSTKRKKKSAEQKQMAIELKIYKQSIKDLDRAVQGQNQEKGFAALATARKSLLSYRTMAKIDQEDGGVVEIPLGNAQEAGHGGVPLGYVVPAFRGGGVSMDYALVDGIPMMKNGQIREDYRDRFQK